MRAINIGILGLGNVGTGVATIFKENYDKIVEYIGMEINIKKILVRSLDKERDIELNNIDLTTDVSDILEDPDIDIIVELMGGIDPAFSYIKRAMENGKHVVTANKAVVASHYSELFDIAKKYDVELRFEGSVGGGIPLIHTITTKLAGNKITDVIGIINGTTNYILTRMSVEGLSFEEALKQAQEKGYAEADPTSDIEGEDVAYKLAIIAATSFGIHIDPEEISCEGISKVTEAEILYGKELGHTVKLLATAKMLDEKLEIHVNPTLIPDEHPLAAIHNEFNAVFIKGNAVGDLMLYGKGAGSLPTGSAVVGDILGIIKLMRQSAKTGSSISKNNQNVIPVGEGESSYYIRLEVFDKPGVLGAITTTFGKHDISIASVSQKDVGQKLVPVIFITHKVERVKLDAALKGLEELEGVVSEVASVLRLEEYNA